MNAMRGSKPHGRAMGIAATSPGSEKELTSQATTRITPMVKTASADTTSSWPRSLSRKMATAIVSVPAV